MHNNIAIKYLVITCVFIVVCVVNHADAEVLVLQDTFTVFDGQMYGYTGCDPEFPLRNCAFINMGGFWFFSVGKHALHVSTVYRSLMGFNFSGLANHETVAIDSAILTLVCYEVIDGAVTLNLGFQALRHGPNYEGESASYIEYWDSSFTWNASLFAKDIDTTLWQTAGVMGDDDRDPTYYTASTPITTTGTYRIDVTGLIEHWFDSSATERWCVLADTIELASGTGSARKNFCSSEGTPAGSRPKLEIFYPVDVRHSPNGPGIRHSPSSVSVRHRP